MTIAVTIQVHDGIVVASDSATTMRHLNSRGEPEIANVYNYANKIFNLHKGLPIGAVTAGAGSIDRSSIATLAKDLRRRFSGHDPDHLDWALDKNNYSIEYVANRSRQFLFEERWKPTYGDTRTLDDLHFWVFGYSSGDHVGELRKIQISKGECSAPVLARPPGVTGIDWAGQPEAITRLLYGISPKIEQKLLENGKSQEQVTQFFNTIKSWVMTPLYSDPMPIMDAIELAEFLGSGLIQTQKAMMAARQTAERKLTASLS